METGMASEMKAKEMDKEMEMRTETRGTDQDGPIRLLPRARVGRQTAAKQAGRFGKGWMHDRDIVQLSIPD